MGTSNGCRWCSLRPRSKRESARAYCTGVSLKRQEYCLLNASISRVFTFPVRSTERLFAPTGSVNVVLTEPSGPIGAENASPLLVVTASSFPVSARSKNKCETSASLQSGGDPGSRAGFARQASASAKGAAPTTPSTMRTASVRMLSSNTANRGGPTCLKPTPYGWLRRQKQTGTHRHGVGADADHDPCTARRPFAGECRCPLRAVRGEPAHAVGRALRRLRRSPQRRHRKSAEPADTHRRPLASALRVSLSEAETAASTTGKRSS